MEMKPNIFEIATKELHQDAFIAWLLQWADPNNEEFDRNLNLCAQDFVRKLIGTKNSYEIKKVVAGRQWDNIDVWAEVNDEYLIIIEDKTFSGEHSNQLLAYKISAEKWCLENNFKLICVYLKTANESLSSLKNIETKGYKIFGRKEFLMILESFPDVSDNIFKDFRDRLNRLENAYNSFEEKNIKDWDDSAWIGFYQFLEKEVGLVNWHYVNPPGGGGFWNAVLNWENWKGYPVYLQIEQGKLCFKIATHPDDIDTTEERERTEVRNEWHSIITNNAKSKGLEFVKRPDRFGSGNYMTAALVDKERWLGENDTKFDKDKVVKTLALYKEFLKGCIESVKMISP